jgi:ABC-type uncharacterized transport system permease subunit
VPVALTIASWGIGGAYVAASAAWARSAWAPASQGSSGALVEAEPAGPRWVRAVLSIAVVAHGVALGAAAALSAAPPGFSESLSGVSLGVMVAVVVLARGERSALGALLAPCGAALMASALLVPSSLHISALERGDSGGWWLALHVGLVLAGVASLCVEFGVAAAQAWVRRRLKSKDLTILARFPALESLERIQRRAVIFGLACLGLGIALGGWTVSGALHHRLWLLDPKVVVSLVVWTWYAATLVLRSWVGWRGQSSMALSAIGFGMLIFSVLGLDFVTRGFHAYAH